MASVQPPLNALRAFEATARHQSFSRAAVELHVTPAALSHQIRGLEDLLGVKLFLRKPRGIELTETGRLIYPGLHNGFTQIRQAVAGLSRARQDRVLVISAPPGFTAKWLAPRLYRFLMANPEIDARISAGMHFVDFAADGVDAAVRNLTTSGRPDPELHVEKLADIQLLPVCSPRLLEQLGGLRTPGDLAGATLIHDDSLIGRADLPNWADWLAAVGVTGVDVSRGLRFNSADHALEATIEGAGVLLAHKLLAHDDLRTGRLAAPFELELATGRAFHFVCPKGAETQPKVGAFHDWLFEEFRRRETDETRDPAFTARREQSSGRGGRRARSE
jgi:LysR family glycine cleavage system transcriptional activator